MRIHQMILRASGILACWLAICASASSQDPEDDTKAILALTELGAQIQLNQQRVIGVTLDGQEIDDDAVKLLSGLDRLQSLTLRNTKVTGAGLKHLRPLTLLGSFSVHDTPLSDRDIDELAALKSVVVYDLRGTLISDMGKQRLERLLRLAKRESSVRLHCGGFLGVAGSYGGARCALTNVVPESAAAEAGLEVGDVIVTFDRRAIKDFTELAAAVALTPPEQPVQITIERDGATKELRVSLRRSASP